MENEQEKNEYIETLEATLENTPSEVREFLWSNTYKQIVAAIAKKFNLSGIQQKQFESLVFDLITDAITPVDVPARVTDIGIQEKDMDSFFEYVYEYLIDIAAEKVAVSVDLNKKEALETTTTDNAPTILSRLSQSFTAPTTITPTKRVYTDLPSTSSSSAPSPSTKPSVDPYRIDPNEK